MSNPPTSVDRFTVPSRGPTASDVGPIRETPTFLAPDHLVKSQFETGLRVVTLAQPSFRSIALGILVQVGSQHESEAEIGLAHLTEHMLFQGTASRSAGQIAEMMDLAGGQIGAFTTRDYTCFQACVLDEHCPYALELLGDLLVNSTFPEEAFHREKSAILCEIEAQRDQPNEQVQQMLKEAVWPGHSLGRPIAGSWTQVQALQVEQCVSFFREHYRPDQVIVAAAGNVDHASFRAHLRDAVWPMHGVARCRPSLPPTHQPGLFFTPGSSAQTYFALGLPAYPYAHEDRYAFHLLKGILGDGLSARLPCLLRGELGLVYDLDVEYQAYQNAGLLVFSGSTTHDRLLPVLFHLLGALRRLALGEEPISVDEVWKSGMRLRRQHLLASEQSHTLMSRLLTQELYFQRQIPDAEVLTNIEGLEASTVQSLAQRYFAESLPAGGLSLLGQESTIRPLLPEVERLLAISASMS